MTISRITNTAPDLRFPEFTKDWEPRKLGDFLVEKKTVASEDVPLYSLTIEKGVTEKTDRYERSFLVNDKSEAYKLVKPNDFAYNPMNLRFGALAKYVGNYPVKVSRYYNVFSLDESVNSFFIECFLKNYNSMKYYNRMAIGSLFEKTRLHFSDFVQFIFPIPTLQEQERISGFLMAVDARLIKLRRKHELLQTYKRGVMQKIFSQEIRFKQNNGTSFPDWQKSTLGEVAIFSKGKGISKDDLAEAGRLKCIRYAELYTTYDEVIDDVISSTNLDTDNLVLSAENDVIIPSSGESAIDIAKSACVRIDRVALGGDLNILRTEIDGVFLAHYLNHHKRKDIARIAQGNTVAHLYGSQLKGVSIEFPTEAEQKKIVDFLLALNRKLKALSREIENNERFKKALLQKMFV